MEELYDCFSPILKGKEVHTNILFQDTKNLLSNLILKAEVKQVIDKVCSKLPSSVKNTCDEFIDTYGDAVVAILAQEIDPATVINNFELFSKSIEWDILICFEIAGVSNDSRLSDTRGYGSLGKNPF